MQVNMLVVIRIKEIFKKKKWIYKKENSHSHFVRPWLAHGDVAVPLLITS